jgi:hypothetical protein
MKSSRKLGIRKNEQDVTELSRLFSSADEEPVPVQGQVDHDWLVKLEDVATSGRISDDERTIISRYKASGPGPASRVTVEEKRLLEKWKARVD